MAYFAMLSGQGWTAIAGCRQFFYARCDALKWLYAIALFAWKTGQRGAG